MSSAIQTSTLPPDILFASEILKIGLFNVRTPGQKAVLMPNPRVKLDSQKEKV